MIAATQFAFAVHHPVSRYSLAAEAVIQRPADHSGRTEGEVIGNGAVSRHPSVWHLTDDIVNPFEVGCFFHVEMEV